MTQDEALTILKTGANVFLTGEPGSGKTYTINAYVDYLRDHGIEPAITASTGIAATHIGGMTIHSWSGIGVRNSLTEYDLDQISQNERTVKRIQGARVLIIDEVSMLSANVLSMVEAVCRSVRRSSRVFGGLQVVLVGDFFQLPPIVKRDEFAQMSFDDAGAPEMGRVFAYQSPAWERMNPIVCYLSEQHRQEDMEFLDVLSAVRRGAVTHEHRALLNERRTDTIDTDHVTQLFPHNANVDRVNEAALAKLGGSSRLFTMRGYGAPAMIEALKRNCLSPEQLTLKVGAKVMFTRNHLEGQYVNGTTGEVVEFRRSDGTPVVRTHDGRTVVAEEAEWSIEIDGKKVARVTQVPLRLAWAITVHKSQGMSLDRAVIDLSSSFEYGQGYVALSRVRSLEGLHLLGLNERALQVHPDIRERDSEFRERSDEATEAFAKLPATEIASMHENFIRACGGKVEGGEKKTRGGRGRASRSDARPAAPKIHPRMETLALIREGSTIDEAAEKLDKTAGTIFKHLEDLSSTGEVAEGDIKHLASGVEEDVETILAAMADIGHEKLTPIFEHFDGVYSYDTIRLARIFFETKR
ncbi:MAG TPA: AAA family ATPase [Candidatus Paceibacterota bacterium]